MYDNIGEKIKRLAKAIFIVEAIVTAIMGIALMATDDELIVTGLLTLFLGPMIAWVASWILYAFGELVEDVHAIRNKYYPHSEENAHRLAQQRAYYEAEQKARYEAEQKEMQTATRISEQRAEEMNRNFVPDPSKTVIPNQYENSFSCPKCGCTLKFGQKECLCSWQMDWSKFQKTLIPHQYGERFSCPKCGCTLKFGQKECSCSWQMDWSKFQ